MAATVLVTDGEERSALAAARSLARAGFEVEVSARARRSLTGASRHVAKSWETPAPLVHPDRYCAVLAEIVRDRSVDLLLPMTEASLLAVLPRRDLFGGTVIPFPSYDRFRAITDKARVARVAREVGIAVPPQVILEGPDADPSVPRGELRFPLVLKPARSIGDAGDVRRKVGVVHAEGPGAYEQALGALPPQAFPLLVQERIEGTGAGVFLLVRDGNVVAQFAHRRIREKPPSGGVSVCRESVACSPGLVESSRALLERFGWEGVAMVEYKIAAETGEAYVMEVNPRLWGSLQLAVDAGVDFPRLMVESALGEGVSPVTDYEIGVRTRWWWGEVDHLIASVKSAARTSGPLHALRTLLRGVRELFGGWGGQARSEVWRWSDPRPFLRETVDWLRMR